MPIKSTKERELSSANPFYIIDRKNALGCHKEEYAFPI
jgi:hypothetical protein